MAKEVDTQGRVVVLTTTLEHAELKRDQIHAYGKDGAIKNCKGSMSATIEPVPGEESRRLSLSEMLHGHRLPFAASPMP